MTNQAIWVCDDNDIDGMIQLMTYNTHDHCHIINLVNLTKTKASNFSEATKIKTQKQHKKSKNNAKILSILISLYTCCQVIVSSRS